METVKDTLPTIEHSHCATHIHDNFRKRFISVQYEKTFWKSSKASTEPLFNTAIKEIQHLSPTTFAYLIEKNPKLLSKTFFENVRMCDVVENGLSATFNSLIMYTRRIPIIIILE